MALVAFALTHFLILLPGWVAMKARTTVMVFANTQETEAEKMMPKAICWSKQVIFVGWPINSKEQRKQSMRDRRRM